MKVLVTGKYGSGKSTFIDGLFDGKVEVAIGGRSTEIQSYTFETDAGSVTVYDTPGQELNEKSQWIQQNCNDVDILLFCIKMTDQVRKEDIQALASLTKTFGRRIWRHTIIVLTHANKVGPIDERKESRDVYYDRIRAEMNSHIKKILREPRYGIGLSTTDADGIRILTAGHPRDHSLPGGCIDWRSAIIDASSACAGEPGKSLLEQVIHNNTLKVSDSDTIPSNSQPDSFFWRMITGCVDGLCGVVSWFRSTEHQQNTSITDDSRHVHRKPSGHGYP